jgi:ABC-type Zn uptake system ZnuABC Zn-binding protein ZnuA
VLPRLAIALAAVASVAALAGCGEDAGGARGGGGPKVVATTTHVADLARVVGGPRAQVEQILRPNADPHEYEPRPSDARALAGAEVVLSSGGDVDDWLGDLLRSAGTHAKRVALLDRVRVRRQDGAVDPHWWQDAGNVLAAVASVGEALSASDPVGRAGYAARATAYARRLGATDRAVAACFRRIPAARRKLVTNHEALGYLAARYGLRVVGAVIPALSTQAQPSAGAVARLVRTIRAARVPTIFPERSVNPRLERAIAREAGAKVGPGLYADALGPPGSPGATVLGALRFNAQAIAGGLGGGRCALPAG